MNRLLRVLSMFFTEPALDRPIFRQFIKIIKIKMICELFKYYKKSYWFCTTIFVYRDFAVYNYFLICKYRISRQVPRAMMKAKSLLYR